MRIREYSEADRPHLLQLMQQLIPDYFAAAEFQDYDDYLRNEVEDYFVIESGSEIIGTGGINYCNESKLARLSWDMISPRHQGKGVGQQLTKFRISRIESRTDLDEIQVRTSQLVYPFYEKSGFEVAEIVKDFWAEGFDLYDMRMPLGKG